MEFELISTRDLFEDDDIVIISRIGKVFNAKVEIIDVAIKDENGDITDPGTIKFLDKCLRDFECFAIANDQEVKLEEAALAKAEKEAAK